MGPEFFKVNIGQVINGLIFVGGIVAVWMRMRYQLETVTDKLKSQEAIVREFESKGVLLVLGQHEARLVKLEALQTTLSLMQTDIALIKQSLSIIEAKQIKN
jgi:hypothetical protein